MPAILSNRFDIASQLRSKLERTHFTNEDRSQLVEVMSLFEQLSREAAKRDLRFLVIGGHAVIEHGFQSGTEDADILIRKGDRSAWHANL